MHALIKLNASFTKNAIPQCIASRVIIDAYLKNITHTDWCVCVSVRQVALLSLFLAVLFALYLVPLGMYSPCIKEEGTLGPAPTLIGHRGAPMVCYFYLMIFV